MEVTNPYRSWPETCQLGEIIVGQNLRVASFQLFPWFLGLRVCPCTLEMEVILYPIPFNLASSLIMRPSWVMRFPWREVWNTKALVKVAFFVWCISHGKILTIDNLIRRQLHVKLLLLVKHDEETMSHLLIHYEVLQELWS